MSGKTTKIFDGDIGYEIRGQTEPIFNRRPLVKNDREIGIEIPNGDVELGRQLFNMNCAGCHQLGFYQLNFPFDQGPPLRGIYLRRAASSKKYFYGQDIRSSKFFWSRKKLWEFIEAPEKMFPETNMSFEGISDPFSIASIIDYLHHLRINTYSEKKFSSRIF